MATRLAITVVDQTGNCRDPQFHLKTTASPAAARLASLYDAVTLCTTNGMFDLGGRPWPTEDLRELAAELSQFTRSPDRLGENLAEDAQGWAPLAVFAKTGTPCLTVIVQAWE